MALENGKWRVKKGDCLWNIAKSVYKNAYKWTDIANANGIKQSNPIIYPNQLLTLPGITSGTSGSGGGGTTPTSSATTKVTYQWFALDSGTTRSMFATWSFSRANFDHYEINWDYDTGAGGWRIGQHSTSADAQSAYTAPDEAKKVRISVKPISQQYTSGKNQVYYWTDGVAETREYDFSNNPPDIPPAPSYELDLNNVLIITIDNIPEDINADSIEFAIYQDDTYKYKTATAAINKDARFCKYTCTVESGHSYKVRCRAVRGSIYGGWTDFTDSDTSRPVAPTEITTLRSQVINEQLNKTYAVLVEWTAVPSAKNYIVEWVTSKELFDTGDVNSQTTEEGQGPRLIITGIELGHEYFFRVGSINDKGQSADYTPIKSVILGTKPSAPTTYSNVNSGIVGENINLYWVHNSTDGSVESIATIHFTIIDQRNPERQPMEKDIIVHNEKPEDEKDRTSVYTINTNDREWANVQDGFTIKWKVKTAGITNEYSDWSIEREINVYAKPEIELGLLNNQSTSVEEVNTFPFYISVNSSPTTQRPLSYYIEIIANEAYETVDDIGNVKMVGVGDKVYQKYYDPQENPWKFLLEMTPGNIDLENNISYTINATVSMNSGLSATTTLSFTAYFNDMFYDVFGDVIFNHDTLEASIHPYCYEYTEGTEDEPGTPVLVENCTLSVYRREYDGTFTEIATGINNEPNLYVTDPHPSLDYARYRIVAKTNDTGAISYGDIQAVPVKEKYAVIQWAEKWDTFQVTDEGDGNVEPPWSGSMLKIPYNISISESNDIDMSLVSYAGRSYPVSYYGTQLGKKSNWSMEIPKYDKDTLYAIRRLQIWAGDVYVREPSGTGYWATISVSYNVNYDSLTIPITMQLTRVEGGI